MGQRAQPGSSPAGRGTCWTWEEEALQPELRGKGATVRLQGLLDRAKPRRLVGHILIVIFILGSWKPPKGDCLVRSGFCREAQRGSGDGRAVTARNEGGWTRKAVRASGRGVWG